MNRVSAVCSVLVVTVTIACSKPTASGAEASADADLTTQTDASVDANATTQADAMADAATDAGDAIASEIQAEDTVGPGPGFPGAFGSPCINEDECDSGVCTDDGKGAKVCTKSCDSDCPLDWTCVGSPVSGSPFVCSPFQPVICRPCSSDKDCAGGGICLPAGPTSTGKFTSFCGVDCSPDNNGSGDTCPKGTVCTGFPVSGTTTTNYQCFPPNGICACTAPAGCCLQDSDCATSDPCKFGGCFAGACKFFANPQKIDCCSATTNPKCDDGNFFNTDCCSTPTPGGWMQCKHVETVGCP